jgi:hypothetical protein
MILKCKAKIRKGIGKEEDYYRKIKDAVKYKMSYVVFINY